MPDKSENNPFEDKRETLATINANIVERQRYAREQETIINDLIESGNNRLLELNYDIKLAKKELRELKTDVRTKAQDKKLLEEDVQTLRTEAQQIMYGPTSGLSPSGI